MDAASQLLAGIVLGVGVAALALVVLGIIVGTVTLLLESRHINRSDEVDRD